MEENGLTHYDVLHVAETAPLNVIRASYKSLVQQYHPDRFSGDERVAAEAMTKRLTTAHWVLSDEGRRAAYDRILARQRADDRQSPPHDVENRERETPTPRRNVRPWPRLWARTIDYTIFGLVVALFVPYFEVPQPLLDNAILWTMAVLFAQIPVEALVLSTFGTTIGKRVFRISVRGRDQPLGFLTTLHRSFDVWCSGMGLGLPLVSSIANVVAYSNLKRNSESSWDRRSGTEVVQGPISTFRSFASGTVTLLALMMCIVVGKALDKPIGNADLAFEPIQCPAGTIWNETGNSCEPDSSPTDGPSQPTPVAAQEIDYLSMGVDQLNEAQFQAGSTEWLRRHPEYNNEQAVAAIQSHLNNVLGLYPRIELGAALDMSLQRALKAGAEEAAAATYAANAPASKSPEQSRAVPGVGSEAHYDFQPQTFSEEPLPDEERPTPLNSIDTPSWEAIRTGRPNERVNPVDPSRVVPTEAR